MDIVHERCAGLDISKTDVKVCVRVPSTRKGQTHRSLNTYGSTTNEVLRLRRDLIAANVTLVVMEATGVYWKPFYFVLEEELNVQLVNPREAKNIPGRKTDASDAERLADLGAWGLLRRSFVPEIEVRQLRDLTRTRKHSIEDRGRVYLRLDKELEDAGIKLSVVASHLTTKSVRRILDALIAGERDPEALADLALGSMRKKIPELIEALTGRFTEHNAFMVQFQLDTLDRLDENIHRLEERIETVAIVPFRTPRDVLTTIPGIQNTTADAILAEIGTDMDQFPTSANLASWAGVCPGQNESAGRHKSTKTRPGNANLKAALGIAVLAISRMNSTSLSVKYRHLCARRGKQRAIVAIEHTLLVIIWNMLKNGVAYEDLGPDYYTRLHPERTLNNAIRQLHGLGYDVALTPTKAA